MRRAPRATEMPIARIVARDFRTLVILDNCVPVIEMVIKAKDGGIVQCDRRRQKRLLFCRRRRKSTLPASAADHSRSRKNVHAKTPDTAADRIRECSGGVSEKPAAGAFHGS